MTVRELIEELEELPMDLPVVTDYEEISVVSYQGNYYFLDRWSKDGYLIAPAVVLA